MSLSYLGCSIISEMNQLAKTDWAAVAPPVEVDLIVPLTGTVQTPDNTEVAN